MAHEYGHFENPKEVNHWKIDIAGARLTSKDIMLKKTDRMLLENKRRYENTPIIFYLFPGLMTEYYLRSGDYLKRRKKLEEFRNN